jgi:hypothetical protein
MAKKQPEKARRWFPRWTAAGWGAFAAVLSVVVAAVGLFISAREGSSSPSAIGPTTTATNQADLSSTSSSSMTASAASEDRYLSDLQPTRQKGCGRLGAGDVTIGGTLYPRSVTIVAQKCTGGGTNYLEYTVPEGCRTFSAVLGLPDTSADDDLALIETTTDTGQHRTIKARRNTATPVTFPLAGALHVRLTMQNLASAGFRDVTAAFGDPKFACGG